MSPAQGALQAWRAVGGWRQSLAPVAMIAARGVYKGIHREIDAQSDHAVLWRVVALGCGIAAYFSLPFEPNGLATALALAVAASVLVWSRAHPGRTGGVCALAFALVLGFSSAQLRTELVRGPVLARAIGPVPVEGRVVSRVVEADGTGKLVLAVTRLGRLGADVTPKRVRISVRNGMEAALPGSEIHVTARLMPPSGPAAPGAYNFARRAYFEEIGAVGFAFGAPRITSLPRRGSLTEAIGTLRENIAREVSDAIPGAGGAVAVVLMTGLRGGVPQQTEDDLRGSGLMHLLSISGLHVSLVALVLFGTLRLLFVLNEKVALRCPTKKWAAAATILGLGAYIQITGASIPAERAYIMAALVLVAVILDRRALTLRNIAVAGGLVLLILPESLLDVSFQMSFAATLALVAAFEASNARRARLLHPPAHGVISRGMSYLGGLVMTSLVAGLATAPFSAFHFQTVSLYGLLSNMVAVPLTGLVVMPALMAAYVLMPLGLAAPAFLLARVGLEGVVATADTVAHLPGAVWHVHAGPMTALVLIAFGGLWLCVWRTRWRLLGIAVIASGIAAWVCADQPDVLVTRDLKTIAIRGVGGNFVLVAGKPDSFDAGIWLKRAGYGVNAVPSRDGLRCDAVGCAIALGDGRRLNLSTSPASLDDDCRLADILISTGRVRRRCEHPDIVIDRLTVAREGALAIRLRGGAFKMSSAGGERDGRPWSPKRPAR